MEILCVIWLFLFFPQLGDTLVQFTEHRILFGQVPVHLTTTKKALLQNLGQNHAFFQVSNKLEESLCDSSWEHLSVIIIYYILW